MPEIFKSKGPQLFKAEVARIAAEVTRATPKSNDPSLAEPESSLPWKVEQLAWRVEDLGDKMAEMRQGCDRKKEDVHFECGGLRGVSMHEVTDLGRL